MQDDSPSKLDDAIVEDTWHCPGCGRGILLGTDDEETPCPCGYCHRCGADMPHMLGCPGRRERTT